MEYELEQLNKEREKVKYTSYSPHKPYIRTLESKLPIWIAIVLIIILFNLFFLSYYLFMRLPTGLKFEHEERYPDKFIAESAARYIKNLTDIGDRVAGSGNLEKTIQFLLDSINDIKKNVHVSNKIEVEHQIQNGSYYRDKKEYPQLNVYTNIQNVIVKLTHRDNPNCDHALLLNSHFDTVPMSPGNFFYYH